MYNIFKRLLDIIISFSVLFFLSPLILLLTLILIFTGEHEAFFSQERVGYKNKKFKLYKFVTMKNCDNYNPDMEFSKSNYSRITPIGKFLRYTKLNELPQFLNVLKGDMSLVGPRPLIPISFEMYSDDVKNKIYFIKPGLTGVGSIFFRDEAKLFKNSNVNMKEFYKKNIIPYKGTLEMWYFENKCFGLDLIILILTACVILFPKLNFYYKILEKFQIGEKSNISQFDIDFSRKINIKIKSNVN